MPIVETHAHVLQLRPGSSMDQWHDAITRGNHAFEHGNDDAAQSAYRLAIRLGHAMVGQWPDHDAAIAALVVAHHNLADLSTRSLRLDEAASLVIEAHQALIDLMADGDADDALRVAAHRHSRRTHAHLLRFVQNHPDMHAVSAAMPRMEAAINAAALPGCPMH